MEIVLNLSSNLYSQNLLMENFSLIEITSELKSLESLKNNNNKYLSLIIISLFKVTLILFYDLDFYYLKSKKKKEKPIEKFIISEQRLQNLSRMFLSQKSELNSDKLIPQLYSYNNSLIKLIENVSDIPALALMQYLQGILQDYKTTIDVITLEKNEIILPKMRDIQDKFEFIHVYNYFKQISFEKRSTGSVYLY